MARVRRAGWNRLNRGKGKGTSDKPKKSKFPPHTQVDPITGETVTIPWRRLEGAAGGRGKGKDGKPGKGKGKGKGGGRGPKASQWGKPNRPGGRQTGSGPRPVLARSYGPSMGSGSTPSGGGGGRGGRGGGSNQPNRRPPKRLGSSGGKNKNRKGDGKNDGKKGKGKGKGVGAGAVRPPLGTFDPALEAQRRGGQRGLADLISDAARGTKRGRQDLLARIGLLQRETGRQRFDINQTADRSLRDLSTAELRGMEDFLLREGDIGREYGRTSADLATKGQRGEQDFDYASRKLSRDYDRLGNKQGEALVAAGGQAGGASVAAAAKRAENKAFEFEPLQTNLQRLRDDVSLGQSRATEDRDLSLADVTRERGRFGEDVGTRRSDIGSDRSTSLTRLDQDFSTNRQLGFRDYGRGFQDRRIDVSRAKREQGIFEADITAQEFFDAAQRDPELKFGRYRYLTGRKGRNRNRSRRR